MIYTHYPQKKNLKDYKLATQRFIEHFRNVPELSAIYRFGEIKAPGISDLDLILVVKSAKPFPMRLRSIYLAKDSELKYLMAQPLFVIDEKLLADMHTIYPTADILHIYGQKISINKKIGMDPKIAVLLVLIDEAIRHFPREHYQMLTRRELHVREALLRLNSLRHAESLLNVLGIFKKNWKNNTKKMLDVRKKWYGLNRVMQKQMIHELLLTAIDVSWEYVEAIQEYIKKNNLVSANLENEYKGVNNWTLFKLDWTRKKAQTMMKENAYRAVLPAEFAAVLQIYANQDGSISSYVKQHLRNNNCIISKKFVNAAKMRIEYLNKQALIANETKQADYPAFFDYGYRSRAGILNNVYWLLRFTGFNRILRVYNDKIIRIWRNV